MSTLVPAHKPDAADQVGGHGGKQGLVFEGELLLKPALMPKEAAFYKKINAGGQELAVAVTPKYFGTVKRQTQWGEIEYIKMENVCHTFRKPSMLDIKVGTRTWDSDCSAEKKEGHILRAKEATSEMHGFVFCGMKVYNKVTKAYTKYPKNYGWDARDDSSMVRALSTFLNDGERVRGELVGKWLPALRRVREFYAKGDWLLFAASVLFVYDEEGGHEPELRLIDFAHAWDLRGERTPGQDDPAISGFLAGIDKLIYFLEKVKATATCAK
eukprot:TRINITY_DN2795_c0_g2_i1.p1 TRINITY_DN2795_c0_g2~~TRINITY_DN2795_c0_g2_i1.p1  ORF type:complete len:270 (+),score=91.12 TRINITY_DN2795_c0_g2_i1:228-1037(+)